ncbi:MAG TPA: response regulator transcription factor [Iamia sp.]|jgi:DNA-binding response OmpR family regulator|nr:response regulator transcription factor [Iamia sp.]
MRVLVVEDDPATLRLHVKVLRAYGLAVDGVRTARAAAEVLQDVPYDGAVLSRRLADGDGLALLPRLGPEAAVVVVTERGDAEQRREGLEAGADDCLTPPFAPDELALRMCKAIVRRTETSSSPVRMGRVVIDRARRTITVDGETVHTTKTELCVLDHLVAHRHRVVGSEELLEHCWDSRRDLFSNPLPSQINRLRARFADHLRIRWTDKGGYLVEPLG